MIWTAIETVIAIFLMIGAGIFISWRKWVTEEGAKILPHIIIKIALPCMIIFYTSTYITREQLLDSWLPLLLVFAVVPVTFYLGRLVAKLFRVPKGKRGVFDAMFSFSNSIFIGFPVALALFKEPGIPFAMFYYLANTTYFWTLGFYSICRDADAIKGVVTKVSAKEIIKKIITPPMVTIVVMFIVILSGITLPSLVVKTAQYLNGLTTPLSLIFMGCMIYSYGKTCVSFEKGIVPVLLGRYLVAPGLLFAASMGVTALFSTQFTTIDFTLMRNVFTVQGGLPVMAQTSIITSLYGADSEYATKSFFWTTLVSLVMIPAYMVLFHSI